MDAPTPITPIPDAQWNLSRYLQAEQRFHHAPADLTDEDLRWIAVYSQHDAQTAAAKRAAAAIPKTKAIPRPPDRRSQDGSMVEALADVIISVIQGANSRLATRVQALERELADLKKATTPLTMRDGPRGDVQPQKQKKPRFTFCGEWDAQRPYPTGSAVVHRGRFWAALSAPATGEPRHSHPTWKEIDDLALNGAP